MASQIHDIRQFEANDFAPLLEAEARAWREALRWDFFPSARQISNCLEGKRLLGYALVVERRIRGYCFYFYDDGKGLIGDLFAESGFAEAAQARWLLDHVLETLVGTSGLQRIEAQLPHFTLEQLEPSFRSRWFQGFRRRFMAASLANRPPRGQAPALRPVAQGASAPPLLDFVLTPWERKHDREAADLVHHSYRHHIDTVINDQYGSTTGALRLIENIVHYRGCGEYLPRASLVAIHRSTQKLAGVLALTAVRSETAHIPQIAVAAQFQGGGLGTAMLESAFQELDHQGYREVSLTVTDLNSGAVRLYERLGFETFHTFGAFVWDRQ